MNKYLIGGIGLVVVFGLGFGMGKDYEYQKRQALIIKMQEESVAQLIQQQELSHELEEIGNEYYKKYQDALSVEPTIVDRVVRVSVKADCPVDPMPEDPDREMGVRSYEARAELSQATIRSLEQLVTKWESDYLQCSHQRDSLITKIKAYNESR